jgi:hypothetical protein
MSFPTGSEDGAEPLASTVALVAPALDLPDDDAAMRIEIENAILKDEGTLGDIYRRAKAGENPEEIQVATTAYVLYQLKPPESSSTARPYRRLRASRDELLRPFGAS